ncbi:TetR/AcrR family transcriptional regulator [Dorea formicigenerans]|nr:TetR/AcrR family transcriptional regulator [Dorea formicigenerans]
MSSNERVGGEAMLDTRERAQNYFKGLTRKDYIEKVCKIIERDGDEDLSIRRIAKELGCSSAALYRYFNSKSELMYYVSLNTLEDYIIRLNKAEETWTGVWDIYVGVWYCYSQEAFRHPKDYNRLFFEHTNEYLGGAIKEFYQMFPDNIGESNQFFAEMLGTADFWGRDYEMCKKCVKAGVLTPENGKVLNRMACTLYKGYLKGVLDDGINEEEIEGRVHLFIDDLDIIVKALAVDLQGYNGYYNRKM